MKFKCISCGNIYSPKQDYVCPICKSGDVVPFLR